ncbi:Protein of unknown function (DUF3055) [Planifilum fimeticola]|jgi:hypothetical protein|uniref:DUF3055 family protein n=1 Tax=Planifilum fimeticola TaxID=201975 RepID=A0A2T0LDX4_9BACL|nr:DUF3055 domain-containing protein [Planifilum fimeticola]PRX40259.1 Protein of unknown function (DUF3055) [Planifilum fimeticola]
MSEPMYLYDEVEDTQTRYVSFVDDTSRFDLALITTERFFGKTLVLNLQSNRYAIIGQDDLEEPGYLEQVYGISPEEAERLKKFLLSVV